MAETPENGNSTDTKPSRRRRTAAGVPGTPDGPPVNWRGSHDHAHGDDFPEHVHPEGQDADSCASQHSDLAFDQGPEANRDMDPDGPPNPEDVVNGEDHEEKIARPIAGRSSIGENPQIAMGDVVIDVETEHGRKLLKLFETRAKNLAAYRAFGATDRDIKKIMGELGHYNGEPINVRVGGHLFSLVATSDDKDIMAFTRHGSQRKSITHPN